MPQTWRRGRRALHGGRQGPGDEAGVLRIDFPDGTGGDRLEHISRDDWFAKLDESGLAFLYQEQKAGETAQRTADFYCASCDEKVHVTKGHQIPECPNGHSRFEARRNETGEQVLGLNARLYSHVRTGGRGWRLGLYR